MYVDERPKHAVPACPSRVLVLKKIDFPVDINTVVKRARQIARRLRTFGNNGCEFWIVLDGDGNVAKFSEASLRIELLKRNMQIN